MSDEPPNTGKRRRRSLRVPVDEVPRPTQLSPAVEAAPADFDGGATLEIPAIRDPERDELADGRLDEEDLLDGAPTVIGEAPSDNEFDEPSTIVQATQIEPEPGRPATVPDADGEASVEVRAPAGAPEPRGGADLEDDDLVVSHASMLESVEVELDDPEPSGEQAIEAADELDAASADADRSDGGSDLGPEAEGAPAEIEEEEGHTTPLAATVVVQRVMSVVVAGTDGPPPPPEAPDELLSRDTAPGTPIDVGADVAVEIDEPEITVDAEPTDPADLEELEVELEEGERSSAPEIDVPDELQDEVEPRKHPSKPPPPPPGQPAVRAAPPPPAPAVEPSKPAAAAPKASTSAPSRGKKVRRKWFEELFNDDYLRTVPIPHPKVVLRQCDFIEQRLSLAPGATILDVGCGLGLHAVELTRRGYLVVGLDLSLPMLSRAADEAQDQGLKINFLHADMREMNFDGAFDAVVCWGTTLGYFDDEANKGVVERLFKALKPRGLLLLEVVNRDYVIEGQPNLVWFEGDGCVVMEETRMNYITSRLEVKRTVILDSGRQRDSLYSIRLYSLHELGQILHHQGFRVVEVSGREAHPGVFFGAASPKLIILAERRPQSSDANGREAGVSEAPSAPGHASPAPEAVESLPPAPPVPSAPPAAPPSEPAPAPEPSEAVDEAMAAALEQSGELELSEPPVDETLDPELLEEEDLADELADLEDLDDEGEDEGEEQLLERDD